MRENAGKCRGEQGTKIDVLFSIITSISDLDTYSVTHITKRSVIATAGNWYDQQKINYSIERLMFYIFLVWRLVSRVTLGSTKRWCNRYVYQSYKLTQNINTFMYLSIKSTLEIVIPGKSFIWRTLIKHQNTLRLLTLNSLTLWK